MSAPSPVAEGRRGSLLALLKKNVDLQNAVRARLDAIERELNETAALALAVGKETQGALTKRETFMANYPWTGPHRFNPWIAAGLVHISAPGNRRSLQYCELPLTAEERQWAAQREVFPPLPRHSFSRSVRLIRNPRCPALASPSRHPVGDSDNDGEGEKRCNIDIPAPTTVPDELHVNALSLAIGGRKRPRPGRRVKRTSRTDLSKVSTGNEQMLRCAYEHTKQLDGITFETPDHATVRAIGEPIIQLDEVKEYLAGLLSSRAAATACGSSLTDNWSSSAKELREKAEAQVLQAVVAHTPGGQRTRELRRWLSRPNTTTLQSFLLSWLRTLGAAQCQDPDICRNSLVAPLKRIQRRRRRPAEGNATGNAAWTTLTLADKVALHIAAEAGLEAHFTGFADKRQALSLALLGVVARAQNTEMFPEALSS